MSAIADIDVADRTWLNVAEYVRSRVEDLKDRCCSVGSSDRERQDCAARIEELRMLLNAPAESRITGDGTNEAHGGRETY